MNEEWKKLLKYSFQRRSQWRLYTINGVYMLVGVLFDAVVNRDGWFTFRWARLIFYFSPPLLIGHDAGYA
jgi:hypothetical protein